MATGPWGGSGDSRVFRCNIHFKRALQNCQTGFHIRDVGVNTLDPEDVATEVAAWAQNQFVKTLSGADDLVGVDVENLVTREGHTVSFSNVHGTASGATAPSFLTIPIALKGSIRRRYGNGRMLWPVATEEHFEANSIIPAAVTILQGAIDDMVTRFMDDGVLATMRLVHLHGNIMGENNVVRVPATWYDVTSIRINTSISSLRRRKVGVGS